MKAKISIKIPYIDIIKSNMEGLPYDFTIKGLRFQEKVGRKDNRDNVRFNLDKNHGTKNLKRIIASYDIGDNDFYWLHFPDKVQFYVFPEEVLLKKNLVGTNRKSCLFISFHSKDQEQDWKREYLFSYDDLDIERFLKLISSVKSAF
jgi:hypothetical protein